MGGGSFRKGLKAGETCRRLLPLSREGPRVLSGKLKKGEAPAGLETQHTGHQASLQIRKVTQCRPTDRVGLWMCNVDDV